jgi:hypothetical protein
MEMRLRPDRQAHRHPRHPSHPTNPYRAWLATGAANREGASQIAGLILRFAATSLLPRRDGEETPLAGHALEFVRAAVFELEP